MDNGPIPRLYNTLTRRLEELPPPPGPIRMYVCGPTVYARAHVGNARPFVVGMWLRAWLRRRGYDAMLVHNITDINDKIYKAAPGASAELAERATQWYLEDTDDLGLGRPDHLPRATETVPQIVRFISELHDRGYAYDAEGDVYFRVARYPEYGQLSNQRPDQLLDEDEEPNPLKEDPRDFALWKASKPGEDTSWESPWGRGRPGWHIECSVMAEELLGPVFEIHGGGLDLVFPHHENELAQARALGHEFARIWTHNGMLRFTGAKMSKSAGQVVTIRDALDRWGREALLLFFMTGHWSKPIDFSDETMEQAATQWAGLSEVRIDHSLEEVEDGPSWADFDAALEDDFDTPRALAILHRWQRTGKGEELTQGLALFGLPRPVHHHHVTIESRVSVVGSVEAVLTDESVVPEPLIKLAENRLAARKRGDFGRSDLLRNEILHRGWRIEDTQDRYRLIPQTPRVQHLGNPPDDDVLKLARKRYQARQEWDDAAVSEFDEKLRDAQYLVDDLIDGYVIVPVSRAT
jgi:cysteinyl-tRNA synthetase